MLNIQVHPDIVLTCICRTWVLVALAPAQKECPYVTRINETGALIWRGLCEGKSPDEIRERMLQEYPEADPQLIGRDVEAYLVLLEKNGYITMSKCEREEEKC